MVGLADQCCASVPVGPPCHESRPVGLVHDWAGDILALMASLQDTATVAPAAERHPRRWFAISPDRCAAILLAITAAIWLSDYLAWPAWHKGYAVLTAVAAAVLGLAAMFLWFVLALVFRWCFQFGLRSLLVFTLMVALLSGWFAAHTKAAREQRLAVKSLDRAGVIVNYARYHGTFEEGTLDRIFSDRLCAICGADFLDNVTSVSINDNLANAEFELLGTFPTLEALDIAETGLTDNTLQYVQGLTGLRELHLNGSITDAGLKRLLALKGLKLLSIASFATITDAGLQYLAGLTQLEKLSIEGEAAINDMGLQYLSGLTHLKELSIFSRGSITDAGLRHLAGLKQLESLSLWSDASITDAGLQYLAGLTRLRVLTLDSHALMTGTGLHYLKGLSELRQLHLDDTGADDSGLVHVGDFTELEILSLDRTKVTDAGLKHLRGLRQLCRLSVSGTRISDAGCEHLKTLRRLESLLLSGTRITDAGLEQLEDLSELRELSLNETRVSDAGVKHLARLKNLVMLYADHTRLTAHGVKALKQALPRCNVIQ
jgi:Leucine-rich repeat (LRR) protein